MIQVRIEPLPDHRIAGLVSTATHEQFGIYAGETLGFLCLECRNLDEDASEIIHQDACPMAGDCKPTAYGPLADPHGATAELERKHPLVELVAANGHGAVKRGETLGWCCVECLCLDETAVEIVHERDCTLDGESGPITYADRPRGPLDTDPGEPVATDGGNEE